MIYYPYVEPDSASRQLRRGINNSLSLYPTLTVEDWKKGNRTFTSAQVEMIIRHLGMPQGVTR
ncbi:MAG: DUF4248 domain-containing protein [Tannerellaceae bacterium]|nr:DUF4248 domain-containing protein [Tannerellaceae bacterium]